MRRRWLENLKDALSVHRAERIGFAVLTGGVLAAAGWATYEQWFRPPRVHDLAAEQAVLDAWLASQEKEHAKPADAIELITFDPNQLPLERWMELGLSRKQAEVIHRYEAKGGRFRSKADLRRMRVVKPELFAQWEPFIQLPDSAPERPALKSWPKPHERWPQQRSDSSTQDHALNKEAFAAPRKLEVNSCDSAQLEALPGIGPSFAKGIIKYRDQLGGYYSLDQLAEVYVLKDKPDAIEKVKQLLVVDTLMIRRIAINTCTVKELAAHPYIRWKIAKPLIAFRQQHGPFDRVSAIMGCALIDEALHRKLAPYLTVP